MRAQCSERKVIRSLSQGRRMQGTSHPSGAGKRPSLPAVQSTARKHVEQPRRHSRGSHQQHCGGGASQRCSLLSGATDNQVFAGLSDASTSRLSLCAVLMETDARRSRVGRTRRWKRWQGIRGRAAVGLTSKLINQLDPDPCAAIQIEEL